MFFSPLVNWDNGILFSSPSLSLVLSDYQETIFCFLTIRKWITAVSFSLTASVVFVGEKSYLGFSSWRLAVQPVSSHGQKFPHLSATLKYLNNIAEKCLLKMKLHKHYSIGGHVSHVFSYLIHVTHLKYYQPCFTVEEYQAKRSSFICLGHGAHKEWNLKSISGLS